MFVTVQLNRIGVVGGLDGMLIVRCAQYIKRLETDQATLKRSQMKNQTNLLFTE